MLRQTETFTSAWCAGCCPGWTPPSWTLAHPKHAVLHRQDINGITDHSALLDMTNASGNSDNGASNSANGTGNGDGASPESDSAEAGKTEAGKTSGSDAGRDQSRKSRGKRPSNFRSRRDGPRMEEVLKDGQQVLCQVIKRPMGHKGARLTTEVSLPGRYVVLVPNSTVMGISRRLDSRTTKQLRNLLHSVLPQGFGAIVRTAAEHVTSEEVRRDVERLIEQWQQIVELSTRAAAPSLLFKEPEMILRILREEFSADYREVVIDDQALYERVCTYMETISAPLA